MIGFQPLSPLSGIAGYRFIERTEESQRAAFAQSPQIARETQRFEERIAGVKTAADLVADPRLLKVALGAFGLDDDANKQAFIRRVLEEGTLDPAAFANRLADSRYKRVSDAFGFGDLSGPNTAEPGFARKITNAYRERQFEIALGESDQSLRVALNFRREIARYAGAGDPDGTAWFGVMGDPPVRRVLEGAFGLPREFGQIDIDAQRGELRSRARRLFGDSSLAVFKDPEKVDEAIRRYLAREQARAGPDALTPGVVAASLLGAGAQTGAGPGAIQNLLLSGG